MKDTVATAGNSGPKVRSDCRVTLEIRESGGVMMQMKSKVQTMFGLENERLIRGILDHYGISDARVELEDSGGLPFVIAARMEAVIRKLTGTDISYLPEMSDSCTYTSRRDRFRFSRLYLPGNMPSMMLNAGLHSPDGLILDLEDSVAPAKKEEARLLVRNALRTVDLCGAERMVRINQGALGLEDLGYVIPHNVHLILVPKCESAEELVRIDREIEHLLKEQGQDREVFLMPIVESALGIERAFEIATATASVVALAIGLEDYTADLGVMRSNEGTESLYARQRLVNAAKAARVMPIDSVFSDVSDMDALRETVERSRDMGFEGMGCIHPRQIPVIHESFAPRQEEIEKALKIVEAFRKAEATGMGVVSLGSKMIDPPVVKRALRTVDLAKKMGLLEESEETPE